MGLITPDDTTSSGHVMLKSIFYIHMHLGVYQLYYHSIIYIANCVIFPSLHPLFPSFCFLSSFPNICCHFFHSFLFLFSFQLFLLSNIFMQDLGTDLNFQGCWGYIFQGCSLREIVINYGLNIKKKNCIIMVDKCSVIVFMLSNYIWIYVE